MKVIAPKAHGYLDYLTVVVFLLAPMLFNLTGFAATLAYLLAAIHLLMTVVTDFPPGFARLLPLRLHGTVELIVSLVLIALSLLVFTGSARAFYLVIGVVIFLVWLLSDYQSKSRPLKA